LPWGKWTKVCLTFLKLLLIFFVASRVLFFRSLVIKSPLSCEFDVCVCYDRLNIIIILFFSQCSAKQICTDDIVRLFAWHHSTFFFLASLIESTSMNHFSLFLMFCFFNHECFSVVVKLHIKLNFSSHGQPI